MCDIFILYYLQLVGFPYPWQTTHRLSLEKYELGFDFKTNQLILKLHLSMLPLDTEQRPIPTFHLGAKKDTVWHCSKPDRKKKKLSSCWLKLWVLRVNTKFNPGFLSPHISQPVLTSDSVYLALVYGVSRASAAFQNMASFNLIDGGGRVTRRSAEPEHSLRPQQNTGSHTVVFPPLPKFPADYLALTLFGPDFSLGSIFGVFHDGEIHLAHFIINHSKAELQPVCKLWISWV